MAEMLFDELALGRQASMASRSRRQASPAISSASSGVITSLVVFRKYIVKKEDGTLDASGILTPSCYHDWLSARGAQPSAHGLKMFRRALSAHVTGTDGRTPFTQEEEKAVLKCLRKRRPWRYLIPPEPMESSPGSKSGQMAFRSRGFHEKRLAGEQPEFAAKKRAKTLPETLPVFGDDDDSNRHSEDEDEDELSGSSSDDVSTRRSQRSSVQSIDTESASPSQMLVASELDAIVALPPPPPSVFNICTASVTALVSSLASLTQRFMKQLGEGWWGKVHEAGRLAVLSLGFVGTPDMEVAKRVIQEYTERYPEEYIIILDHQERDFRHKYMCLNDLARKYFGNIGREDGGTDRKRYHPDELVKMYKAYITPYLHKGEWIPCKLRHRCVDGKFRWFQSVVMADYENHFVIERGRLVDHAPVA